MWNCDSALRFAFTTLATWCFAFVVPRFTCLVPLSLLVLVLFVVGPHALLPLCPVVTCIVPAAFVCIVCAFFSFFPRVRFFFSSS